MNDAAKGFLIALGLALVVALGLTVWLLGRDRLMTLALILIIGLVLAVLIGASALPIRAYRRRDPTGETHYVHDGTRTVVKETKVIDGRAIASPEVKLLQLPAQAQGGAFPELLRAAYQAGTLALGNPARPAAEAPIDAELREVDPSDPAAGWADWQGDMS